MKKSIHYMLIFCFLCISKLMNIRIHIRGEQNLKKIDRSGVVLAINHVSYIDPVIFGYVYFKITKELPIFVMKDGLAKNFIGKFCLVTFLGNVAINRDAFTTKTLREIGEKLKKNNIVIYPQGTLQSETKLNIEKARGGAAFIAKLYKTDVLPIVHIGCDRVLPSYGKKKLFSLKKRDIYVDISTKIKSSDYKKYSELNQAVLTKLNDCIEKLYRSELPIPDVEEKV